MGLEVVSLQENRNAQFGQFPINFIKHLEMFNSNELLITKSRSSYQATKWDIELIGLLLQPRI